MFSAKMLNRSIGSYQNQYCLILYLMILMISCCCTYVSCSNSNLSATSFSRKRCLTDQSVALLQFKQEFAFQKPNFSGYYYACSVYPDSHYEDVNDSYPKMKFWKAEKDCCSWDGVACDLETGQVVGLDLANSWLEGPLHSNSSLFKLHHLQEINLSFNNFTFGQIPSEFGQLSRLTHLNLSFSMFTGNIPSEISFLTNMVALSLSSFKDYDETSLLYLKKEDFTSLIKNMTNLSKLFLHQVNLSSSLPESLVNLSSLTHLRLGGCDIYGKFPENIFQLPKLEIIYVPCNYLLLGFLQQFQPSSFLRVLNLDFTKFSGPIPSSIWNLSQLTYLDLSWNHFNGHELPFALGNLAKLNYVRLQYSQFRGQVPSSVGNLTQLRSLQLSGNNLDGFIPSFLFRMPHLNRLNLDRNQFTGPLSIQNVSNSSQMKFLTLGVNKLNGQIPQSMFKLVNLEFLDLENNHFSGTLEFSNFTKLVKLRFLGLSVSGLSITKVSTNFELPKLRALDLASCDISEFPNFLKTQDQLEVLDLFGNRIEGEIPKWFWGTIGKMKLINLDLRYNKLQGSLTVPPLLTSISYFSIVGNNLTGIIDPSFRKWTNLKVLDMSNNYFGGTIPPWLGNLGSSLEVLDLHGNNFSGIIPQQICSYDRSSMMRILDLSHNQLQGNVPQSLVNCCKLEVLNLGHNQIRDKFPFWLHNLPELRVLVLGSNKFFGPIWHRQKFVGFVKLGIIDLSFNHFNGSLPSEYFRSWSGMINALDRVKSEIIYIGASKNNSNYSVTFTYTMSMVDKGSEVKFRRIPTILTSIDLSNNRFDGEIPSSIGNLRSLIMLNLSSNSFSGTIPLSVGAMSELESLDLSKNSLSGRIPQQLTNLTFLEYLNLCCNQLTGPIPQGRQFDTFSYSSFEENPGLCGSQVFKKCENMDTTIPFQGKEAESEDDDGLIISWKVVVLGYGCGMVVGLIIGHLIFFSRTSSNWFWTSSVGRTIYARCC
ncbi:receptor-like protein 7 isoform X2 [Ziziphus jujuba]|uniref:Receptor-like protein 7 isoform X2 n=1 Tax=Ziziphus jujuba TaxID=326968 RepID=A0ABM3ZTG3_ZIZJJ|nr:receptor-like protein 7 isoform X2 [Ziziphus jujuba]